MRRHPRRWGAYGFVGTEGRLVGHNSFLDGNLVRSSPNVAKNFIVGDVIVGFNVVLHSLELGYTHAFRTSDALLNGVLSSNGKWIAVAGADPTVRLLDPKTGQLVKAIEAHADWVTSIAFTPDSSRILTVSRDKTARCFAVPGGESISAYLESSEPFLATQCERGGAIAFAAGRDHQIHAWKMEDGKRVSVISVKDREVLSLVSSTNRAVGCAISCRTLTPESRSFRRTVW